MFAAGTMIVFLMLPQAFHPKLCHDTNSIHGGLFHSPHIEEPAKNAVLSVISLQQYPACFAPLQEVSGKGWVYRIAGALKARAYDTYRHWNFFISLFGTGFFISYILSIHARNRKEKRNALKS